MILISVLFAVACVALALKLGITDTVTITWASGGLSDSAAGTYTNDTRLYGDYVIPNATVNQEIALVSPVAPDLLLFFADGALTILTNSTGAPGDTIVLEASKPALFRKDSDPPTVFAAAVTKIYVSNASGATVNLKIRGLKDGTP